MERVRKGKKYWYIDDRMFILECIETGSPIDDARYKVGNYFHSPHKLSDMSFKIEKVLKGADVIEMPSKKELETMVQDSTHKITCGDHDRVYAADGQGKILDNITYEKVADIIRNTVEQLKSKIIK